MRGWKCLAWAGPLSGLLLLLLLLLGNPRIVLLTACICCPVFPLQPSGEESSSDETSHGCIPALRRRRAKKRLLSSSESEEGLPPHDLEVKQAKHLLNSGLNRCIILALVIAVSMGFGHFYGERRRSILRGKMGALSFGNAKKLLASHSPA